MALSTRQWAILGASAAAGYVLARYRSVVAPASILGGYVSNVFARGSVLSSSTLSSGVVQEDPQALIDEASGVLGFTADPDTFALAKMGRSEGVDGMEGRMHVALNDLASLQATYGTGVYSSILALMIHSKNQAAEGHFSIQKLGKRYSTAADPYVGDYQLAQKVQQDHASGIDPTGGATHFVDKDGDLYVNHQLVDYDTYAANMATQGFTAQSYPGASDNFVIFTRTA